MADAAKRFVQGRGKKGKVAVDMRLFDIIEPVTERLNH
jgi:hypothetical protein